MLSSSNLRFYFNFNVSDIKVVIWKTSCNPLTILWLNFYSIVFYRNTFGSYHFFLHCLSNYSKRSISWEKNGVSISFWYIHSILHLIRYSSVCNMLCLHTFLKEAEWSTSWPSDKPKIQRYDLFSYRLFFNKEKKIIHFTF